MNTPTLPTPITLSDGVERHLRYTLGTLRRIKAITGKSALRGGLAELDEDLLPALIFEGLTEKTGLDVDKVADLIDMASLPYVAEQFARAFGMSMPERKSEDAPGPLAEFVN